MTLHATRLRGLSLELQEIANELAAQTETAPPPPTIPAPTLPVRTAVRLSDPNPNLPLVKQMPNFGPDGRATEDFWVRGVPGAKKGAHSRHYGTMRIVYGIMGWGSVPPHNNVMGVGDENAPWQSFLTRAGNPDVNWLDGSAYRYNHALTSEENFAAWCRAGSPTKSPDGQQYDTRGKPIAAEEADFSPTPASTRRL